MRIVHLASGREWRGGQRQVWLLARELSARRIDQVVITGRRSELARRLSSSGLPVREVSWSAGLDPRVIPPVLRELRQPALLHAHDAHALTLAGVCSWISGASYVATRRVTFPLHNPFFWRRACQIIAISRAVRDALARAGLDPSRLTVVPSAYDPAAADEHTVDIRTRLNLSPGSLLAVTLGALTPEKDHSTLIAAASLLVRDLPELQWAIVGEGKLERQIRDNIAELDLAERVHLVDQIEDPHQVLAQADLFVLSSVSEGLGSSILAAMARGLPIVATRVGGVPDLLGSGAGVLVEPRDPEQLAQAVARVLTNPELKSSLAARAREEAGKYTASAMADRIVSVYRSCAHSFEGA